MKWGLIVWVLLFIADCRCDGCHMVYASVEAKNQRCFWQLRLKIRRLLLLHMSQSMMWQRDHLRDCMRVNMVLLSLLCWRRAYNREVWKNEEKWEWYFYLRYGDLAVFCVLRHMTSYLRHSRPQRQRWAIERYQATNIEWFTRMIEIKNSCAVDVLTGNINDAIGSTHGFGKFTFGVLLDEDKVVHMIGVGDPSQVLMSIVLVSQSLLVLMKRLPMSQVWSRHDHIMAEGELGGGGL